MAYASADDMIFGKAVKPVKAGLGLEIGAGYTTPEVNYAPRPEAGEVQRKARKGIRKDHHRHNGKDGPDRSSLRST